MLGDPVGIELPPPVALVRLAGSLEQAAVADACVEPKWDGWRAVSCGGRVWSRRGAELSRYLPDLAPVLARRLPEDVVVDGELVVWNPESGRLDFGALQARLTAGQKIDAVAARHPVQLMCFDLLAAGGVDLRGRPLVERRSRLEEMLSGMEPPVALCPQTRDPALAADWLGSVDAAGLEGLVVKPGQSRYLAEPGRRPWWKVKIRTALDMVAIGVIGDPAAPVALVLARPAGGRAVAATTVLPHALSRQLGQLLVPTGGTWQQTVSWGTPETATVRAVAPMVVEVSADTAVGDGPHGQVFRHPVRLLRTRPDPSP